MVEKIEWAEVSPDLARELLEAFASNRRSSDTIVDKYARLMSAGKWFKIGEPICIGESGATMNGAHRLRAVIRSGCTVTLPFIWGVPAEAMGAIDTGKARTYADLMQMEKVPNANLVAAVVRRMWYWDRGQYWLGSSQGKLRQAPSHAELDDYRLTHPEVQALVSRKHPLPAHVTASTAFVGRIVMARKSADDEDQFWSGWVTGADLPAGSPILALTQRLARDTELRARHDAAEVKLVLACMAWNGYRQNRPMIKLQLPVPIINEKYPLPI